MFCLLYDAEVIWATREAKQQQQEEVGSRWQKIKFRFAMVSVPFKFNARGFNQK